MEILPGLPDKRIPGDVDLQGGEHCQGHLDFFKTGFRDNCPVSRVEKQNTEKILISRSHLEFLQKFTKRIFKFQTV
jgi:hypothetical protein